MKLDIFKQAVALTVLLVFTVTPAYASGVTVESKAEIEVTLKNEAGEEKVIRVNAADAKVKPGTVVIYTITYTNGSKDKIDGVVINNPMPEHTEYVGDTAEGAATVITFSVDGGASFGTPVTLKVKGKDGKKRTAMAKEYTNIRWAITEDLLSGESGTVGFRVKVK